MLAMQYSIHLPVDFDEGDIKRRVEERHALFKDHPGMIHKSYLFNENDKLYAPFYIWDNMNSARDFLLTDLFRDVMDKFSRPRVRCWLVQSLIYANESLTPTFAIREADSISPDEDLSKMMEKESKAQQDLLGNENLYLHAIALDPDRWELIRYSLWQDQKAAKMPASDCIQTYDVLHVSEAK